MNRKYICNGSICYPVFLDEKFQNKRRFNSILEVSTNETDITQRFNVLEAKVILQTLDQDKVNANNRIYDIESYKKALEDIQERLLSGRLWGELGHPLKYINNPVVLFNVDEKEASHIFKKVWIEGNIVYGIIKTLPTPNGELLKKYILFKDTNIGFSLRADADEFLQDDGTIYTKVKKIITWDAVAVPSHRETKVISFNHVFEQMLNRDITFSTSNLMLENTGVDEGYIRQRLVEYGMGYMKKFYKL